jgi:hypothetical protein
MRLGLAAAALGALGLGATLGFASASPSTVKSLAEFGGFDTGAAKRTRRSRSTKRNGGPARSRRNGSRSRRQRNSSR